MLIGELKRKYGEKGLLYQVHLDLTYRCNLKCVHCYINERRTNELSTGRILRLVDEMYELKTLHFTLSGGELFLRPDLFEIIEYARSRKFAVRIKTSGTLIEEGHCAKLRELGIMQAEISIYSMDEAVHDAVTKVPGSFRKAMSAIEALGNHGVRVRVNYTVTKPNAGNFRDVIDYFKERGIEVSTGTIVFPFLDGGLKPVMLNIPDSQRGEVNRYKTGSRENPPVPAIDPVGPICGAGRSSLYIAPDGAVYPCVAWHKPVGSIAESSLKSIWEKSFVLARIKTMTMSDILPLREKSGFDTFCPGLLNA